MKISNHAIRISGVAAVGLFALACGRAVDNGAAPAVAAAAAVSCGQNQVVGPGNVCMPAVSTIQDLAYACGGGFDPYAKTCTFSTGLQAVTYYYQGYNSYAVPTLTPDQPTGPFALLTHMPLNAGDVVTVAASGAYGSAHVGSFYVYTTPSSCSQVDLNGLSGSQAGTNGGLPAGLVGSDGTKVYALGANGSFTAQYNGKLILGLNLPSNTQNACGSFSATITIKRNS